MTVSTNERESSAARRRSSTAQVLAARRTRGALPSAAAQVMCLLSEPAADDVAWAAGATNAAGLLAIAVAPTTPFSHASHLRPTTPPSTHPPLWPAAPCARPAAAAPAGTRLGRRRWQRRRRRRRPQPVRPPPSRQRPPGADGAAGRGGKVSKSWLAAAAGPSSKPLLDRLESRQQDSKGMRPHGASRTAIHCHGVSMTHVT